MEVDLGVITRTFALGFDPATWLASPYTGLGEHSSRNQNNHHLYAEVVASRQAVLFLSDSQTGRKYAFEPENVQSGKTLAGTRQQPSVEVIEKEKVWLHGRVLSMSGTARCQHLVD